MPLADQGRVDLVVHRARTDGALPDDRRSRSRREPCRRESAAPSCDWARPSSRTSGGRWARRTSGPRVPPPRPSGAATASARNRRENGPPDRFLILLIPRRQAPRPKRSSTGHAGGVPLVRRHAEHLQAARAMITPRTFLGGATSRGSAGRSNRWRNDGNSAAHASAIMPGGVPSGVPCGRRAQPIRHRPASDHTEERHADHSVAPASKTRGVRTRGHFSAEISTGLEPASTSAALAAKTGRDPTPAPGGSRR